MIGASNAVNLTDGMDGLAISCSNSAMLAYLLLSYAAGYFIFRVTCRFLILKVRVS